MILNREDLFVVLDNVQFGLISHLKRNFGKYDTNSLKLMREGVTCLSYVLKTHNPELKHWAVNVASLML